MVTGDLKSMSPDYLRAATMTGYGVTLYVGLGIPFLYWILKRSGQRQSGTRILPWM